MAIAPVSTGLVIPNYSFADTNVQKLAPLQLAMSQDCREVIQQTVKVASINMEKVKTCYAWLDKCHELLREARLKGGTTEMPYEMSQYFKEMKLNYARTPEEKAFLAKHPEALDVFMADNTAEQWEYNIKILQGYGNSLFSETKQQMTEIQDFMGQYNSYLTGAKSALQQ
jgi:hypothetical protein